MKTYYIIIAITEDNINQVFTFISSENQNFKNIGGNRVFEIIPNPKNPVYPCYRFELKEVLVNEYRNVLETLKGEIYENEGDYLMVYPSNEMNEDLL